MGILSYLKSALLPDPKPPSKLPSKPQATPTYLGVSKGTKVSNTATNTTSIDRSLFARNAANMNDVVANLVRVSPDVSHALATKISAAITRSYTAVAYDETGRVDVKGTEACQALLQRWEYQSTDYSRFTRPTDLRSISTSLLQDALRYGGFTAELVLGKGKFPSHIRPVDTAKIEWADNMLDSYPIYKGKDGDVPLNFPTIFYSATQQSMHTPYSESPLQAAIQPALHDTEFQDTLRRAATKNLLQRLRVTIDSEKWMESLPYEVRYDEAKLQKYKVDTVVQIEEQLNGLSPEDSLVVFSTLDVSTVADANRSEDRSIEVLNTLISGQLSSGAKILPAIIGRAGEGSNAASTEALLFLRGISTLQLELNIMLSRILTLSVRLMGNDVSVKFAFEEPNLRPELELESFRSVKQARLLKELSLGLRADEEVSIALTGTLPPAGYTPLSGTMFDVAPAAVGGNDYSNTSAGTSDKTDSTQATKDSAADEKGVAGGNSPNAITRIK